MMELPAYQAMKKFDGKFSRSTQYTNVTDRQRRTPHDSKDRAMHSVARQKKRRELPVAGGAKRGRKPDQKCDEYFFLNISSC